ncbi:Fe-Mn family superoxide dismutase [uncultured Sphingobium sp.]|jgi:superoxide dismutase, Fe-Mn family|uniref:superoxide dismutase n=1 Tax=uncultured Sphingobium sp. TaxID=316087 RepID=UPI0032B228BE
MDIDRRTAITAGLAVGAAFAPAEGLAQTAAAAAATKPEFEPKPLPFDPSSVSGLSAKLLISHHDNNYLGAVKRLGSIRDEFRRLDPASAPGYVINGLKREELIAWNSMILHELYFASFSGSDRPSDRLAQAIERDFGSHARWAAEFVGMGKALGGGSGWVLLNWSERDGKLVNQWAADHTMALAGGTPLIALDMYEHAYAIDYGAKAADYVHAFMKALAWDTATRRFDRASSDRR